MKYWIFFIITIIFSSCNGRNINTLKNEKVKFKDLPVEVTHYLRNPDDYHDDILYMLIELPKGKENNYRLGTVKTWIGPWESHKKLINIKKIFITKLIKVFLDHTSYLKTNFMCQIDTIYLLPWMT